MGNLMNELITQEKMKEYHRRANEIWQYRSKGNEPALKGDHRKESRRGKGKYDRGVVCSTL